ncbi:MAG TPA: acetyl-CoA carboxylase biotin carboxyl carrier protein [Phycisphaerae bacterium]|nr:acetyl-CoA carboxylase biotin carboxyl carrier protein [Phycisphaerae bacterium]
MPKFGRIRRFESDCMDIEEIKTLTQLMVDNDLSELILRDGERRIMLRRRGPAVEQQFIHAAPMPQLHYQPPMHAPPQHPAAAGAPAVASVEADAGLLKVTSPMVGTYYAASNPESPPFVRIGDRINAETVVCIIEAMKVFNEIKAEVSGVVESIEVQDKMAVEFGQVLLRVRPG